MGSSNRIAVVGASSLAGKELSDALGESQLAACDVVLLDDDGAAGQMTTSGDEATFIQRIDADAFVKADLVFFVGDEATTRKHWKAARKAGASIIDMTYALEGEAGVMVRAPWIGGSTETQEPDLTTPAVVAAHPAALMLLMAKDRLTGALPVNAMSATVFEPASEHGQAAMDELHQQTVSLLSFQSLPREQYDAQVAFNLLPSLGKAAKVHLAAVGKRIADHYATLSARAEPGVALQMVQAPAFHGYVISLLVELQGAATRQQMEAALSGEHVDVVGSETEPPSNVSAAGREDIQVRVEPAGTGTNAVDRFWVWMAADNLKLAAMNAIACAVELGRLRPQGKVQ